jgi:hypothetical protein
MQMIDDACERIQAQNVQMLGFDMEWPVKFTIGQGPGDVALIQLCYRPRPSLKRKEPCQSEADVARSFKGYGSATCSSAECSTTVTQLCQHHQQCSLKENGHAFRCLYSDNDQRPFPTDHGERRHEHVQSNVLLKRETRATSSEINLRAQMLSPVASLQAPGHAPAANQNSSVDMRSAQTCKHDLTLRLSHDVQAQSISPLAPMQVWPAAHKPPTDAISRSHAGYPSGSKGNLTQPTFPRCQCLLLHVKKAGTTFAAVMLPCVLAMPSIEVCEHRDLGTELLCFKCSSACSAPVVTHISGSVLLTASVSPVSWAIVCNLAVLGLCLHSLCRQSPGNTTCAYQSL